MFVADECTPMMGVWLFGWQGRFETCPYVWRIASMERVGCCGGGGAWCLVGVPRSAPGIPRSVVGPLGFACSRPFALRTFPPLARGKP